MAENTNGYIGGKVTPVGVFKAAPYSGNYRRQEDTDDTPTPDGSAADPNQPTAPTGRDNDLPPEEATFKKRYGDLRAESMRKEAERKKQIEDLQRQVERLSTQVAPEAMPKTKEQLAAWAKEFPEVASAIKALAREEVDNEFSSVKSKLELIEQRERALRAQEAAQKLRERHSDIDSLRADPAFHEWARSKSKLVQDALYGDDDDPDAASDAITLYKTEKGLLKKTKQRQAVSDVDASLDVDTPAGVAEPLGSNKKIWSESQVAKLSDKDYEKYEEEIAEAVQEGRFKYDLSDSAA